MSQVRPLPKPARGLSDRLLAWRDRLLLNPLVHRWAFALPLARRVARRRARQLFDLCAGFVYTQTLLACVKLQLIEHVLNGPQSAAVLGQKMGLTDDATQRLLAAAAALELIERRGADRYGLGVLGAALLANPGIAAMVNHHPVLYDDLRDPVALLRGEFKPAMTRYWAYTTAGAPGALEAAAVAEYSALMAASQPLVADEILDAYPFARHRQLLDVGGGEGVFISAVARRAPGLGLTLFDLPAVAERARTRLAHAGLAQRVTLHGGSFLHDPLPQIGERGADLVSLVRVIHDHEDDAVLALLARVRQVIDPQGTLVVAEPMAQSGASLPVGEAYFAFYLLAMGSGRSRTLEEIAGLLQRAGFGSVRRVGARRPVQVTVLTAKPT